MNGDNDMNLIVIISNREFHFHHYYLKLIKLRIVICIVNNNVFKKLKYSIFVKNAFINNKLVEFRQNI